MPLGSAKNPPRNGREWRRGVRLGNWLSRHGSRGETVSLVSPSGVAQALRACGRWSFRPHPRHAPMDTHFQRGRARPRWPSPVLFPSPLTQPYRRGSRLPVAPGCPDRRAHPGTTCRVSGGLAVMVPYRVLFSLCKGNHTPVASNGKPMCLFNRQPG